VQQLYYTSCPEGRRVDGGGRGFGIRAKSAGISKAEYPDLVERVRFTGPDDSTHGGSAPVRLALLLTPRRVPVLVHSVAYERSEKERAGNYFTHLLVQPPGDLDAARAIRTWGSPDWRREDLGGDLELPELERVEPGPLADDGLRRFIGERTEHRSAVEFLIDAHLQLPATARLFLIGESEGVAWSIYGLTRLLPRTLIEGLTFSTYEGHPRPCEARIVGTLQENLPAACSAPPNAHFSLVTGRGSSLPALRFTRGIVDRFIGNQPIDDFIELCQRCRVQDAGVLSSLFEFQTAEVMEDSVLDGLVRSPETIRVVVGNEAARSRLIARAVSADPSASELSSLLLEEDAPELRAVLAEAVIEEGASAVRAGDMERSRRALEVLLPKVAGDPPGEEMRQLFARVGNPATLPGPLRSLLIGRLPQAFATVGDAARSGWLDVQPGELPEFLELPVPAGWKTEAVLRSVADGKDVPEAVAARVAARPEVLAGLLQRLASSGVPRESWLARAIGAVNVAALLTQSDALGLPAAEPVVLRILRSSTLLTRFAARPEVVEFLKTSPEELEGLVARAVASGHVSVLKDDQFLNAVGRQEVAGVIVSRGFVHLASGDLDRVRTCFDELLPAIGQALAPGVWRARLAPLASQIQAPACIAFALSRLDPVDADELVRDLLTRLRTGRDVQSLMAHPLAEPHLWEAAARYYSLTGTFPDAASRLSPGRVCAFIESVPSGTESSATSALVAAVARSAPRPLDLLRSLVDRGARNPRLWPFVEVCLDALSLETRASLGELVRFGGIPALDGHGCSPSVERLALRVLDETPSEQIARDGSLGAFLDGIASLAVRPEGKRGPGEILRNRLALEAFFRAPVMDLDRLHRASVQFRFQRNASPGSILLPGAIRAVATPLRDPKNDALAAAWLLSATEELGGALGCRSIAFYDAIISELRSDPRCWTIARRRLLASIIRVAIQLGLRARGDSREWSERVQFVLRSFQDRDANGRPPTELVMQITRSADSWSDEEFDCWNKIVEQVNSPTTVLGHLWRRLGG